MIATATMNASIDKLYQVERVEMGSVMRVKSCGDTAGGKGLNVSRIARSLGEQVLAVGIVGGHAGRRVEELLRADGVESDFAKATVETRCCVNVRDISTGVHTEFLEPGAQVGEDALEDFYERFQQAVKKSSVVAISGSLPAGVPADCYAKLASYAKEQGKRVIVDASGEALRLCLGARPTMLKPNMDEIQHISREAVCGRDGLVDAVRGLHGEGVEIAAVSMGKDGVLVACGEGVFHGIPPAIQAVNTVGCGDSMVAGFAVGLSRNWPIQETVRLSVAVSAANALCEQTGSYRREDLERLLPLVEIKRIEGGKHPG
jgi:tagatose 6-phosphate kinase